MWNWIKEKFSEHFDEPPLPPLPPIDDAIKAMEQAEQAKIATHQLRRETKRLSDAYVESIMQAIAEKERRTT